MDRKPQARNPNSVFADHRSPEEIALEILKATRAHQHQTSGHGPNSAKQHEDPGRNAREILQTPPLSEDGEGLALLWTLLSTGAQKRCHDVRITVRTEEAMLREGVRLGVFVNQKTEHTNCTRNCAWESLGPKTGYVHPVTGRRHSAVGNVYACRYSGRLHTCDGVECVRYIESMQGTYICTVSGRSCGQAVAAAEASALKATIRSADVLTMPSAPPRPKAPLNRFSAIQQQSGSKRKDRPEGSANCATNSGRFSPGSACERFLQNPANDGIEVSYGAALIRHQIGTISEASNRLAPKWWELLLTSSDARRLHDSELASEATKLEETIAKHGHLYDAHPSLYAMFVYESCLRAAEPHVERAAWLTLGKRANNIGEIIAYLSKALLYVWKIVECTPHSCEYRGPIDDTGAPDLSAKALRQVSRHRNGRAFHLDKCALSIVHVLAHGHAAWVDYDALNGNKIISPAEAARLAAARMPDGSQRARRERVEYVPPHAFLKAILPAQNKLRKLDFSSVLVKSSTSKRTPQAQLQAAQAARFNPGIVTSVGALSEAYRSLSTHSGTPLTIEQVREYRLAYHLTIRDFRDIVSIARAGHSADRAGTDGSTESADHLPTGDKDCGMPIDAANPTDQEDDGGDCE